MLRRVSPAAVAAGAGHSLALLRNGVVVAWGANGLKQCDVPAAVQGQAEAVAAGGDHSLALLRGGGVVAWGRNDEEQCDVPAPVQGRVM